LGSANLTKTLLELFCERLEKLYLIIDGLDDCSVTERRLVLQYLGEAVKNCDSYQPGKLRVLIVSQDCPDIGRSLAGSTVVPLGPQHTETDIRRYVEEWTTKIQKHHKLDDGQAEYIRESTCARAGGKFSGLLWKISLTLHKECFYSPLWCFLIYITSLHVMIF
jgi:hypothetical protein